MTGFGIRDSVFGIRVSVVVLAVIIHVSILNICEAAGQVAIDPKLERAFLEGNYNTVVADSTKLIDGRSSKKDQLYYARAIANMKLNKTGDARRDFEVIVAKYPRSARIFDSYMGIADSYFLEGNYDEAARRYEEIPLKFRNNSNVPLVYYKIGCCYRKNGSNARADEYFEKAKKAAPHSFETRMIPQATYAPVAARQYKDIQPAAGGNYTVQVGSFKSRENADKMSRKLASEGYTSHTEAAGDGMLRVKAGKFSTKNEAEDTAQSLRNRGYSTKICSGDVCQ
jgi:tetratricopeptide (TPR) repeat protein